MRFSVIDRQQELEQVIAETFDLCIIGGGITGVGIALDAIARGLSVLLLEMQDFAEGTSSRSTKLVHGGLRYLKQLDIKEVAELGRERRIVYENGPHVTTPIWMLLPFHKGGSFGKFTTALGLKVYDLLAGVKKDERRLMLSKEVTIEQEPLIKQYRLIGSGMYVEYRTDDARLTIEVAKAAKERGAYMFNYMKVLSIQKVNVTLLQIDAEDRLTGQQHIFRVKKVVNAAGPWVDQVRALDGTIVGKHLTLSKGVHIVFDASKFPLKQAIYFDTDDGRMIFAIPRQGKTYVGTTDTFYEGNPEDVCVEQPDIQYLLKAIKFMFPTIEVSAEHIESTWAGVRPLIHEEGKGPSEISRKDEIWQSESGVITIAGGKLTGYRKMAEKIVNVVVQQLEKEEKRRYRRCTTKRIAISGGDLSGSTYFDAYVQRGVEKGLKAGLTKEQSHHLVKLYGTNIDHVLSFTGQAERLPINLFAQLYYGIYFESVAKPTDFFIRRTGTLFFDMPTVEAYKEAVIDEMQHILSWSESQKEQYREELEEAIRIAKVN